jgi:hypothetical protein
LPFALALPAALQTATVVIVFQSLVELFGMVAYLWAVPRLLPTASAPDAAAVPAQAEPHDVLGGHSIVNEERSDERGP